MKTIRVLIYEGEKVWMDSTLKNNKIKSLVSFGENAISEALIREVALPANEKENRLWCLQDENYEVEMVIRRKH